jgi:hypothetical protein
VFHALLSPYFHSLLNFNAGLLFSTLLGNLAILALLSYVDTLLFVPAVLSRNRAPYLLSCQCIITKSYDEHPQKGNDIDYGDIVDSDDKCEMNL